MPRAERPPSTGQSVDVNSTRPPELLLPGSIREWVPALALWPALDERRFRLVASCLEADSFDWESFRQTVRAMGLAVERPQEGWLTISPDWLPLLERDVEQMGGSTALRDQLVTCWLTARDPHLAADMARISRDLERWPALVEAWISLNQLGEEFPTDVLELYRDLPTEARVAQPLLSWSIGAATAMLADPADPTASTMPHGMLLDAAVIHAGWSTREDTDLAVQAGTLRMLGQRRQPSARPGASLEEAWRTKEQLDAFIETRSSEGKAASRRTLALFRAFSAQLALFRGDFDEAIREAQWAALLAEVEPLRILARGAEALAVTLSTDEGAVRSGPPIERIGDPLRQRGMRGLGEALHVLADGHAAMQRLDRAEVERCLSLVSPAEAAFGGVWAVRTSLEAFHAAYWGDLTQGYDHLMAEISRQSRAGREQDEPFGGGLLNRARTILLTKLGAFTAAASGVERLREDLRLLPQARIHLWAGEFEQAIRVAARGDYAEDGGIDHSRLRVLRGAAALLNGTCDERLADDVRDEMRRLVAIQNFVPVAMLPEAARSAILGLCEPDLHDEAGVRLLTSRLAELNDAGNRGVRAIHLTERERVLLPLLATDTPVPEIARKLQVSVNTVRKQVVTLREKFGATTRAELIRKAQSYGALD